jgi:hypothetical protein
VLDRLQDRQFELRYVRNSGSFRLTDRLRRSAVAGLARTMKGGGGVLRIRATGRKGALGQGSHVWVLRVSHRPDEPGVPWTYVEGQGFSLKPSIHAAHGRCAQTEHGDLNLRTGDDPEVVFQTFPWAGIVEVEFNGRTRVIDLSSERTGTLVVHPARPEPESRPAAARPPSVSPDTPTHAAPSPSVPSDTEPAPAEIAARDAFLQMVARDKPDVVAIHCPRWLGISSATGTLFDACYRVPHTPDIAPSELSGAAIDRHARTLAESGVKRFVISGGDPAHRRLVMKVKALRPDAVFDVLWHGSYMQVQDDYEWAAVKAWVEAARAGLIRGIATVKKGMEDYFRALGVPSALLLNYVPGDPLQPPRIEGDGLHAGVWISGVSFRKMPHAMLAALRLIEGARLHSAGMDERAHELASFMGLSMGACHPRPLPYPALLEAIRRTHVTLYVTFSECCPMLPLESMRVGVPCLMGPVSHLLEDDAYLFGRLVVPFPDRADVIARYAVRAAEERQAITDAYARYVPGYNQRARESVRLFIEQGPTLAR